MVHGNKQYVTGCRWSYDIAFRYHFIFLVQQNCITLATSGCGGVSKNKLEMVRGTANLAACSVHGAATWRIQRRDHRDTAHPF